MATNDSTRARDRVQALCYDLEFEVLQLTQLPGHQRQHLYNAIKTTYDTFSRVCGWKGELERKEKSCPRK